jgi:hypothetical protein
MTRIISSKHSLLTLFDNARIIHPQLRQLEIHPAVLKHYETMRGGRVEHQTTALQTSEAITNPEMIKRYLAMSPLVVTRADVKTRRWQVVARIAGYHLSTLHLTARETVTALVIPRPSETALEQLIVQDHLVNPLLEVPLNNQVRIWGLKSHFENVGALASLGLAGISKRTWAKWLHCDPRRLHEEE